MVKVAWKSQQQQIFGYGGSSYFSWSFGAYSTINISCTHTINKYSGGSNDVFPVVYFSKN
jgi:hypothetical protein